jgi:hypothetical protein
MIGLLGGLSMGSLAAARRTASSFSVYWASTNPSDLIGVTGVLNPTIGSFGYNASLIRSIAHLPDVKQVESQSGIDFLPLQRDGKPLVAPNFYPPAAGNGYGSVDGLYFNQDRVTIIRGRLANPNRANEMMLSAEGASALFVRVGSTLPIGIYTNAQTQLPGFGTARVKPLRIIDEKVVGIFIFSSTIVEDAADAGSAPNNIFTPALTRQFLKCCTEYSETGIQVNGGERNAAKVISEMNPLLKTKGFPPFQDAQSAVLAKAQRAIQPEAIALGVFGGVVALAALLIAGQLIGRELRLGAEDRDILRSLGAWPAMTSTDGLFGAVGAVIVGVFLAALVAVILSPIAPLGPVRFVYPYSGIAFDWTVLGFGVVFFATALSAIALVLGYRGAPHRSRLRDRFRVERPSRVVSAAAAAGLPPAALTGVHFALQSGRGRNAVPVRSAMFGAAMAMVALSATMTFGSSLNSLVTHPALYGWNWDYALIAGGDVPRQQATTLLNHDRYVAQWSSIFTATLSIDGQSTPVLGERPGAKVAPPILSGHGLKRNGEVVLGTVTLAQLHKQIGDTVEVSSGSAAPTRLRIVGTATLPTLGSNAGAHLEMGTGAVLSYQLIPASDRNPFDDPIPGPDAMLVRLRSGFNRSTELRSLDAIARATTNTANFGVSVTGVLRPAEIVNYRTLGATPVFLGAGIAGGALLALALTLIASVRRRRRDLALLRTLGFTGRQLMATVAWQSTIAVGMGIVIGVPLGIAVGRWLWDLFARSINAVPAPSVPALPILLTSFGALILANVIAAFPERIAARTPTALLLRAE